MRTTRRLIAATLIVALIACNKKESNGDQAGPTASPLVEPKGPKVGNDTAALVLPEGMEPSKVTVASRPVTAMPPHIKQFDDRFKTLAVVELGPDGTQLASPGVAIVAIDPAQLPAGRKLADIHAITVASDGTTEDLAVEPVDATHVRVQVHHFSWLIFGAIMTGMVLLGTAAVLFRGVSDPMMRKDCADYLTPDSPKIAALSTKGFALDAAAGTISPGVALGGGDVTVKWHARKADQVLEKGVGDCVNMSTVMGSLLLSRKYPVRLVAGTASYPSAQGFHQWAETVIDTKPYYVDTFEPSSMKLIPLEQARAQLKLESNRVCGKNPDGTTVGPTAYSPDWWKEFATDAEGETLKRLVLEHKNLVRDCDNGVAGACADRQSKYEEAKKLQEQINAKKAPPSH